MKRRLFIETCGVALVTGGMAEAVKAQEDRDLELLLLLAAVVVPDKDNTAWSKGACREELTRAWRQLEASEKQRLSSSLHILNAGAQKLGARDFRSLTLDQKTALLRTTLNEFQVFAEDFQRLRSMITRAFYSSPLGLKRTGYIRTTQFRGYPEFLRLAKEWE